METKGFMQLIKQAKYDDFKLLEIINRLQPLINSYIKKLFFLEREDAKQEIILSIIESVKTISVYKNDYECISYIHNAVKYKYAYLCKKNIKANIIEKRENEEQIVVDNLKSNDDYQDIDTYLDMEQVTKKLSPQKQTIFNYIIQGYSDSEIANLMGCSRQYINRVKKTICF